MLDTESFQHIEAVLLLLLLLALACILCRPGPMVWVKGRGPAPAAEVRAGR